LNKFVLIVEFQVKPECLDKFNQAIAVNANASVAEEPGCRQFDVLHNQDDPNHIVLYEVYDSPAAFQDHMGRKHTQGFLAQAKQLVTKQTAYKLKRTVAPPVKQ
jgi:(4S)-4-hydroxy-5-phosphonooxypentane-2,3-dione isomerase